MGRIADHSGEGVQAMCERLAAATGYRAATVDLILWRACANGLINSLALPAAAPDQTSKDREDDRG